MAQPLLASRNARSHRKRPVRASCRSQVWPPSVVRATMPSVRNWLNWSPPLTSPLRPRDPAIHPLFSSTKNMLCWPMAAPLAPDRSSHDLPPSKVWNTPPPENGIQPRLEFRKNMSERMEVLLKNSRTHVSPPSTVLRMPLPRSVSMRPALESVKVTLARLRPRVIS